MSTRTPGLQPRSQYHSYWGQYAWTAGGSDPGAGNLPNDTLFALGNPYYSQLEVGDTASTTDANPANVGLWVCISKGTLGGANAVWRRLDNGAVTTQSIRDAHVMVVAQSGTLAGLGALVDPNKAANNYNLTAAGDVVSVTCDYLDTGNGVELYKALEVAGAAALQIDIRLRPCSISLVQTAINAAGGALPLNVPSQCRLVGGGRWISFINSDTAASASQEVFKLEARSELIDVGVTSGTSAGTPTVVASKAMVACSKNARVERCFIAMDGVARAQPWGIWDDSATVEVLDCQFYGANQTDETKPSIAIALGSDPAVSPDGFASNVSLAYRISGCTSASGADGGFNKAVYSYNVAGGGHISGCDWDEMDRPALGVIQFAYGGAPVESIQFTLPTVSDTRITVSTTDVASDTNPYVGVAIISAINIAGTTSLNMFEWTGVRVLFDPAPIDPFFAQRGGYAVIVNSGANAQSSNKVEGGIINGCSVLGDFDQGVFLFADGSAGGLGARISDIRIGDGVYKNPLGGGSGIELKTSAHAIAVMDAVGISNCDCKNAPATATGVFINQGAGSTLSNTIVLGNNLTPSGGTALSDTGTGTEAAHNILT